MANKSKPQPRQKTKHVEFKELEPNSREAQARISVLACEVVRDATGDQLPAFVELLTHIIRHDSSSFAFYARLAAMRSSDELLDSAADLTAATFQIERKGAKGK